MTTKVFAFRLIGCEPHQGPEGVILTGSTLSDLFGDIDELCNPHALEFCEIKQHFWVNVDHTTHGKMQCSEALQEALPPDCWSDQDEDQESRQEEIRTSKKKWRTFEDLCGIPFDEWYERVYIPEIRSRAPFPFEPAV